MGFPPWVVSLRTGKLAITMPVAAITMREGAKLSSIKQRI